mgnify:CR=1 FL=1
MTIAILAHDSRKELALQFCTAYSAILSRNNVIATGTTGRMLAQTTGLPVSKARCRFVISDAVCGMQIHASSHPGSDNGSLPSKNIRCLLCD